MEQIPVINLTQKRLTVRLAQSPADLDAVQALRWRVFYEEMGAQAAECPQPGSDADDYDALCDHLLVVAEAADGSGEVVGTYRLLRESVARRHHGFYSAHEFDLEAVAGQERGFSGELLELGRSCVLPAYRTSGTISLLWRGITDYVARHGIAIMFGCASFPGTDPQRHALALGYLFEHHLAPPDLCPVVLPGGDAWWPSAPLPADFNPRRAAMTMPPLVKAYLRVGAMVGRGAFIDRAFNTVDVCMVMPVDRIVDRYAARFSAAA